MWPFRDSKNALPTYDVANTIGAGSCVRGDLSGPGGFRIEGTVEGGIDADGPVVIGEGGVVDGEVRGRDVLVLGRVRGDVHATGHLEIGPKGKVLGDITVQSFRMHRGGVFRGLSSMPSDEVSLTLPNGVPVPKALAAHRGRTLPPPTGAGAVPPPPTLAELAAITPLPSASAAVSGSSVATAPLGFEVVPVEPVSEERLVTSGGAVVGDVKRAVG